jgi:NTE family protein
MDNDSSQGDGTPTQSRAADKVAFVLSGGGNRGALEVGVILALLEHGIRPRILVGTSVGAINATAMAINPTLEGAKWLENLWRQVTKKDVLPDNYMSMIIRLLTGRSSLFDNKRLKDYLESRLPKSLRTFADIKSAELYITAADLRTGELRVFGIDHNESVLDAVMASSAYPLILAPWEYQGRQYVDGALASDLPIRVAVQMKASAVYAIDVGKHQDTKKSRLGVLRVIRQILNATAYQRFINDMGWANQLAQDKIHYIRVDGFDDVGSWDFNHTAAMIEKGHKTGTEYLRRLTGYAGRQKSEGNLEQTREFKPSANK